MFGDNGGELDRNNLPIKERKSVAETFGVSDVIVPSPIPHDFIDTQYVDSKEDVSQDRFQFGLGQNQEAIRAGYQSTSELWGKAITQGLGEATLGTLESIGYLVDFKQHKNILQGTETEYSNWFSDLMKKGKEYINEEVAPVYRTEAAQSGFAPGDGSWWASNAPSIASALSLLIPAWGATKAASYLGKAVRALGISAGMVSKVDKASDAVRLADKVIFGKTVGERANGITQAVFSRYMENTMEASGTYDEYYQKAIAEGKDPQLAAQEAGEAASTAWKNNWGNIVFDIAQYMSLTKGLNATNHASKAFRKNLLEKSAGFAGNVVGEGIEEGFQFVVSKEAQRKAEMGEDYEGWKDITKRISDYSSDAEFKTSVLLGAVGGGVFTGIGKGINKISEKITKNAQLDVAKQKAIDEGDLVTAHKINDAQFTAHAYNQATEGKLQDTMDTYKKMGEATDEELSSKWQMTPEQIKDFRERNEDIQKDLAFYQEQYLEISDDTRKDPALLKKELDLKFTKRSKDKLRQRLAKEEADIRAEVGTQLTPQEFNKKKLDAQLAVLKAQKEVIDSKELNKLSFGKEFLNVLDSEISRVEKELTDIKDTLGKEENPSSVDSKISKVAAQEAINELGDKLANIELNNIQTPEGQTAIKKDEEEKFKSNALAFLEDDTSLDITNRILNDPITAKEAKAKLNRLAKEAAKNAPIPTEEDIEETAASRYSSTALLHKELNEVKERKGVDISKVKDAQSFLEVYRSNKKFRDAFNSYFSEKSANAVKAQTDAIITPVEPTNEKAAHDATVDLIPTDKALDSGSGTANKSIIQNHQVLMFARNGDTITIFGKKGGKKEMSIAMAYEAGYTHLERGKEGDVQILLDSSGYPIESENNTRTVIDSEGNKVDIPFLTKEEFRILNDSDINLYGSKVSFEIPMDDAFSPLTEQGTADYMTIIPFIEHEGKKVRLGKLRGTQGTSEATAFREIKELRAQLYSAWRAAGEPRENFIVNRDDITIDGRTPGHFNISPSRRNKLSQASDLLFLGVISTKEGKVRILDNGGAAQYGIEETSLYHKELSGFMGMGGKTVMYVKTPWGKYIPVGLYTSKLKEIPEATNEVNKMVDEMFANETLKNSKVDSDASVAYIEDLNNRIQEYLSVQVTYPTNGTFQTISLSGEPDSVKTYRSAEEMKATFADLIMRIRHDRLNSTEKYKGSENYNKYISDNKWVTTNLSADKNPIVAAQARLNLEAFNKGKKPVESPAKERAIIPKKPKVEPVTPVVEEAKKTPVKEGVDFIFESNPELANEVYEALDFKSKPDVILPIGTSGSGKSTFIKSLPQENLVIIEPDAMRVEFTGDMNNKSKDKEIYIEAANRAIKAIKQGKQVVFDTTNLTKEKRLPFIDVIKKEIPNANIQYKLMELNPELAKQRIKAQLERGENRAAVSDATIDRHAASYKQMLKDIKNEPISNFELTPQQKQHAQQAYSQYLESLNKSNTNPILQNNQQEQVKKFAELQERLNNKEFLEGAKNAYESTPKLQQFGTQEEYNDYMARVSLGIIKNPSSGDYNYTSQVKDIVYRGSEKEGGRLFQYFTKNSTEAYMYAKANITKGGNITERNPIPVIKNNVAKKYNLSKNILWAITDTQLGVDGLEFEGLISKDEADEAKRLINTNKDIQNLQKLIELYPSVSVESESDLMKQFDDSEFIKNKPKYDKIRKELDSFFSREQVGKITIALLNIKNPYTDEIVQEDLENDRNAYKNGHDGAFLMDGDHFLVKSNTEQIHILGSKQDIQGFREVVGKEATIEDIISQEEYDQFVDKGIVTEDRIQSIAEKVKVSEQLSPREMEIFTDKTGEINAYLAKEISIKEAPTYIPEENIIKTGEDVSEGKSVQGFLFDEDEDFEVDRSPNVTRPRKSVKGDYKVWNREEELSWFKKHYPNVPVSVLDDLKKISDDGSMELWGLFKNGSVYIASQAKEGTVYHEAFHAVFHILLNENERSILLREFKGKNPIDKEENMADHFMNYKLTQGKEKTTFSAKVKDFFKRLYHLIQIAAERIGIKGDATLDDFMYRIDKGLYNPFKQKVKFTKDVTRFSKAYNSEGLSPREEAMGINTINSVVINTVVEVYRKKLQLSKSLSKGEVIREVLKTGKKGLLQTQGRERITELYIREFAKSKNLTKDSEIPLTDIREYDKNTRSRFTIQGLYATAQQILEIDIIKNRSTYTEEGFNYIKKITSKFATDAKDGSYVFSSLLPRAAQDLSVRFGLGISIDRIVSDEDVEVDELASDEGILEGWQVDVFRDHYSEFSERAKIAFAMVQKDTDIAGYPVYESPLKVYVKLSNSLVNARNESEMATKLATVAEMFPSYEQIVNIVNNDPNIRVEVWRNMGNKRTAVFLGQKSEKTYENGEQGINTVTYVANAENLSTDIVHGWKDSFYNSPMFNGNTEIPNVPKEHLTTLEDLIKEVNFLNEKAPLKKSHVDSLFNILKNINIPISKETLYKVFPPTSEGQKTFKEFTGKDGLKPVLETLTNSQNPFYGTYSKYHSLKNMGKIIAAGREETYKPMFRNGEGKNIMTNVDNRMMLDHMLNLTAKDNESFIKAYQNTAFYKNSPILEELKKVTVAEKTTLAYLDSFTVEGQEKAIQYKDMSPQQLEALQINFWVNPKEGRIDSWAYYLLPILADSTNAAFMYWKKEDASTIREKLIQTAQQERDRIEWLQKRIRNVKPAYEKWVADQFNKKIAYKDKAKLPKELSDIPYNLLKNGLRYQIFSGLNEKNLDGDNFAKEVNKLIDTVIESEKQKLFDENILIQVVDENGNITYSDDTGMLGNNVLEGLRYKLDDYLINRMYMNIQTMYLFGGDVAQYKSKDGNVDFVDVYKRIKQIHSPQNKISVDTKNEFLLKDGTSVTVRDNYYNAYITDPTEVEAIKSEHLDVIRKLFPDKSEAWIIENYESLNNTDAATYIDLFRMREIYLGTAKWTEELQEQYDEIILGKAPKNPKGEMINVLKPFNYTHRFITGKNGDVHVVPTQIKNSEALLTPRMAKGNPKLEKVLEKMGYTFHKDGKVSFDQTKRLVDAVVFSSAVKVGQFNVLDNIDDIAKDNVHRMSNADYAIQQETPEHYRDSEVNIGTQLRKLITQDLNHSLYYMVNGEPMLGSEVFRQYQEAINLNIKESFEELKKMFYKEDGTPDLNGIVTALRKEVVERKMGEDMLSALDWVDKNKTATKLPLWDAHIVYQVEAILSSYFKNNVTKQKAFGMSLYNASSYGYEKINEQGLRKPQLVIENDENGKPYIKEVEVLMPAQSRALYDHYIGEDGYLDVSKVPDELKMGIFYRIPTEGKYSMFHIKVIGYLEGVGGQIIMPDEVTTIAGLDFDIDKLFGMMYNFENTKDGLVKIESGMDTKESRDNLIIDIKYAILSHSDTMKKQLTPGNFKLLEKAKERVLKLEGNVAEDLNMLLPSTQREIFNRNMTGAALIGQGANQNVHHALVTEGDFKFTEGIAFNGDSWNELSKKKDKNGKFKSSSLAQFIAAYVDNAKDPMASFLNITTTTSDLIATMIRVGHDPEAVLLMVASPAAKKFSKELAKVGKSVVDIDKILDMLIEDTKALIVAKEGKEALTAFEGTGTDVRVTEKTIEAAYKNPDSIETLKTNVSIYQLMQKTFKKTQALTKTMNAMRFDAVGKAAGPMYANIIVAKRAWRDALAIDGKEITGFKKFIENGVVPFVESFYKYGIEMPSSEFASEVIEKTEEQEIVGIEDFSSFVNYSGGATGGDTIWENIGKEFNLGKQVNFRPEDLKKLTKEQLQEVENAYQQAVKDLGRRSLVASTYSGGLVRRDYLQAKAADAVYAISVIVPPGEKDPKGYINRTNRSLVAGGTGYAVQMAINMGKPVYVFDQQEKQWYSYERDVEDPITGKFFDDFIEWGVPILTPKFAGIGTREINDAGKQAIRDVYETTLKGGKDERVFSPEKPLQGKNIILDIADLPYEKPVFAKIVERFALYKRSGELDADEINSIYRYIMTSFVTGYKTFQHTDFTRETKGKPYSEVERVISQTPKRLSKYRNENPDSPYNIVLEQFKTRTDEKSNKKKDKIPFKYLAFNRNGLDKIHMEAIRNAWKRMLYSEIKEERILAVDLIKYAFFSSGHTFNYNSFTDLVPMDFMFNLHNNKLDYSYREYQKGSERMKPMFDRITDPYEMEGLFEQIVRNGYRKLKSIPFINTRENTEVSNREIDGVPHLAVPTKFVSMAGNDPITGKEGPVKYIKAAISEGKKTKTVLLKFVRNDSTNNALYRELPPLGINNQFIEFDLNRLTQEIKSVYKGIKVLTPEVIVKPETPIVNKNETITPEDRKVTLEIVADMLGRLSDPNISSLDISMYSDIIKGTLKIQELAVSTVTAIQEEVGELGLQETEIKTLTELSPEKIEEIIKKCR